MERKIGGADTELSRHRRGCGVEQARSDDTACQEKAVPIRGLLFSYILRGFEPTDLNQIAQVCAIWRGRSGARIQSCRAIGAAAAWSKPDLTIRRARKKQSPSGGCFFLTFCEDSNPPTLTKSRRSARFGEEDRGRGYRAVAPSARLRRGASPI